ncbi:hypothetical protein Xhom_02359 [Xenorhabdus hominickii]|uniref:Uncharacterized protein n=1 Tax=Xenorhabdus hominickii TaxID=351679 RepID=A0A2G0Q8Q7_XENHO|nr:hypothetical protein Xhom_02359 [Xenorhabdus hominickii]
MKHGFHEFHFKEYKIYGDKNPTFNSLYLQKINEGESLIYFFSMRIDSRYFLPYFIHSPETWASGLLYINNGADFS